MQNFKTILYLTDDPDLMCQTNGHLPVSVELSITRIKFLAGFQKQIEF